MNPEQPKAKTAGARKRRHAQTLTHRPCPPCFGCSRERGWSRREPCAGRPLTRCGFAPRGVRCA
eukprot:2956220-Prymnesium_polylepis.1